MVTDSGELRRAAKGSLNLQESWDQVSALLLQNPLSIKATWWPGFFVAFLSHRTHIRGMDCDTLLDLNKPWYWVLTSQSLFSLKL